MFRNFVLAVVVVATVVATVVVAVPIPTGTPDMVQFVHRHGDRAPITVAPTTVNFWKGTGIGPGELSPIGKQQLRSFGRELRRRYLQVTDPLMNPTTYDYQELVVRSSDVDRTLQSAQELLSMLYPGGQTIPIHTVPQMWDNLLQSVDHCASYVLNYPGKADYISSIWSMAYPDLIQLMMQFSGWTQADINGPLFGGVSEFLAGMDDNLVCLQAHGYPLPNFNVTGDVMKLMHSLKATYNNVLFARDGPEDTRGAVGSLLGQTFLDNIQTWLNGLVSAKTTPSMYHYSAHDDTVAAMYTALGLYSAALNATNGTPLVPPYAMSVVWELFATGDNQGAPVVRMYWGQPFINATAPDGYSYRLFPLVLPCSDPANPSNTCALADLISMMSANIVASAGPDYGCCDRTGITGYLGWVEQGCGDANFTANTNQLSAACQIYRQWCPASSCDDDQILSYGPASAQTCLTMKTSPTAELCWRWLLLGVFLTGGIAVGFYCACKSPTPAQNAAATASGGGHHQAVTNSAGGQASDSLLPIHSDHKSEH